MSSVFTNLAMAVIFGYDLWLYSETGEPTYMVLASAFALWMVLCAIDRNGSQS